MKNRLTLALVVGLLLIIIGVPFVLHSIHAGGRQKERYDGRLIILTPHPDQIRFEIAQAFNRYRAAQGKDPVEFDWRVPGGASDIRKQILTEYGAAAKRWLAEQPDGDLTSAPLTIEKDLFFGGGDVEHNLTTRGVNLTDLGREYHIAVYDPIHLPIDLFREAFPQPDIGGMALYEPRGVQTGDNLRWVGTALSSFGIVYNRDRLAKLGIEHAPTNWPDLTDPRYQRQLAQGDPGRSGSVAQCFNIILRRYGWTRGWQIIRRTLANSRYVTDSGSKVPIDVSNGNAAAGLCIDFYGRFQSGAVGQNRVGFVEPVTRDVQGRLVSMTLTGADPITLLRGAPNRALAEEFIAWLLSKDAQRLWQRRKDESGGPVAFELRRLPIRRDLYTVEEAVAWTDPEMVDVFERAQPLPENMPDFFGTVAPVVQAMAISTLPELQEAWAAINNRPSGDAVRDQMEKLFDAMPPELTPVTDDIAGYSAMKDALNKRYGSANSPEGAERLLTDQLAWTAFFRLKYREIVRLGS